MSSTKNKLGLIKNCLLTTLFLVIFLLFPPRVLALICSSPKKGAAGATLTKHAKNPVGILNFYHYFPYSNNQQTTPMLKRGQINILRSNQNPDVCNPPVPGCEPFSEWWCCPAQMIRKTVNERGTSGYWLIFNEPYQEDGYPGRGGAWQAADDAAFAISFIKKYDPNGKFIVGWLEGIQNYWSQRAPNYGLSPNINEVISGWHLHLYGATIESFEGKDIVHHPVRTISPGKEIWITEFGTLGGLDCRYDYLTPNCIRGMKKLLNWLEKTDYVSRYFWWNFGPCDPRYVDKKGWRRDMCWGPLTEYENYNPQNKVILSKLGKAFAEIPNTNGQCDYPPISPTPSSTPTPIVPSPTPTPRPPTPTPTFISPTPTTTVTPCPNGESGNFDCDSQGLINEIDLTILLNLWETNEADLNQDGKVDGKDLSVLLSNWRAE